MGPDHASGIFAQNWIRAFLLIVAAAFLIAAPLVKSISAAAVPCPDGANDKLGPGVADSDLLVTAGTCTVNAGTYMYRNINITNGGVLQFSDATIDLWAANIIIENKGTMRAGSVAADGTITPINGPLTIHLYGANQGPGAVGASCTDATCGVPDGIWGSNNTNKMFPDACTAKDLPGRVKNECFYPYDAMPFDNGKPLGYYGYKVLGVGYGGTLQLYGKKGATYDKAVVSSNTGTSWVG